MTDRKAIPSATEPRPSIPTATATRITKSARFSEKPSTSRQFDPEESPRLLNARYSEDWAPLTPKEGRPWRPYDDSSAARGGSSLFRSIPGTHKALTLRSDFLARFKSVQSYEQRREAEANAQGLKLSDRQVGYGTINYKIDLLATATIKARQVGILQDPRHMGLKVPTNVDITATMLVLTFGPFEKVEDVAFWSARVPASIAPTSAKPPR